MRLRTGALSTVDKCLNPSYTYVFTGVHVHAVWELSQLLRSVDDASIEGVGISWETDTNHAVGAMEGGQILAGSVMPVAGNGIELLTLQMVLV